jgi:hypothetical protein
MALTYVVGEVKRYTFDKKGYKTRKGVAVIANIVSPFLVGAFGTSVS